MLNQIEEFIRGLEFNQNTDHMLQEVKLFLDFTSNLNLQSAQRFVRDHPENLIYWTYVIEDLAIKKKDNILNASRIQVMLLVKYFYLNNQDFSSNQDGDDNQLIFLLLQRKIRETQYENKNNELGLCKKLFQEVKQYKNSEIIVMQIIIDLESSTNINIDELVQYQLLLKDSLNYSISTQLLKQCLLLLLRQYQMMKSLPEYNFVLELKEIGMKYQMQEIVSHACHIILQSYYNDQQYLNFIYEYEKSEKHLNKDTFIYYIICKLKQAIISNKQENDDIKFEAIENVCQQVLIDTQKLDFTNQELRQIFKGFKGKQESKQNEIWVNIQQIIFLQEWIIQKQKILKKQNGQMTEQIIPLLELAFEKYTGITKQYYRNMSPYMQRALQEASNYLVDIISDKKFYSLLINDKIMMSLLNLLQKQAVDQEIKKIVIRLFKLLEVDDFIKKQETRGLLLCLAIQYDLKRFYNCEIFKDIIKKPFKINFPITFMLFIEQLKLHTQAEYEQAQGRQLYNMLKFTYKQISQDKVCFHQLLTIAVQKEQEFTNQIIIKFIVLPFVDFNLDIIMSLKPIFYKLNNSLVIEQIFKKIYYFIEDQEEENQTLSAFIYNIGSQFSNTEYIGYYQSLCSLIGYLQYNQINVKNIEQIQKFYQSKRQIKVDDQIVLILLNDIHSCINNLTVEVNILFDTILNILDINNIDMKIKINFYQNLLNKAIQFQQNQMIIKLVKSSSKTPQMFESIFYLIREQKFNFKQQAYSYLQNEKLSEQNKVVVLSYLSEFSDEDDGQLFLQILTDCLEQIGEKKSILPYLQMIYLRLKILIQYAPQHLLEKGNQAILLLDRIL